LPESEIVANLIRNFVIKPRRARYLSIVAKPGKHGGYGFGELAHFTSNLDTQFCLRIPSLSYKAEIDYITNEIRSLVKSEDCYILHESKTLDGQWMQLEEAVKAIAGQNEGAFIILDNGQVMYHESETLKERYIGVRKTSY
jgi:hypothetical protein